MATYYNISISEFRNFLKAEKGWTESAQNNEIVFNYNLSSHPFITIKVFSGIDKNTGQSRGCGNDALRICAINTRTNTGWIKSKTCYRLPNWQNNLKSKILLVIEEAKKRLNPN